MKTICTYRLPIEINYTTLHNPFYCTILVIRQPHSRHLLDQITHAESNRQPWKSNSNCAAAADREKHTQFSDRKFPRSGCVYANVSVCVCVMIARAIWQCATLYLSRITQSSRSPQTTYARHDIIAHRAVSNAKSRAFRVYTSASFVCLLLFLLQYNNI